MLRTLDICFAACRSLSRVFVSPVALSAILISIRWRMDQVKTIREQHNAICIAAKQQNTNIYSGVPQIFTRNPPPTPLPVLLFFLRKAFVSISGVIWFQYCVTFGGFFLRLMVLVFGNRLSFYINTKTNKIKSKGTSCSWKKNAFANGIFIFWGALFGACWSHIYCPDTLK